MWLCEDGWIEFPHPLEPPLAGLVLKNSPKAESINSVRKVAASTAATMAVRRGVGCSRH